MLSNSSNNKKLVEEYQGIQSLPVLYCRDGNSNLTEWKDSIYAFSAYQHSQHAVFFRTGALYVPAAPVAPEGYDADQPNTPQAWEYSEMYKLYAREKNEVKTIAKKFYGLMWGNMSAESRSRVQRHQADGWANCEATLDAVGLLTRINATHGAGAHQVAILNVIEAQRKYEALKMTPDEDLVIFKRKFDVALQSRRDAGEDATVPNAPQQAAHFITKLDPIRYSGLQAHLANNAAINGAEYPATLATAFQHASNYVVVDSTNKVVPATVMSINVDEKSSKSKSDFKSKPSNENHQKKSQFNFKPKKIKYNQQGQNSNFSQNQQNQNNFCHICNKNGHSTDRCYFNMKNNKEKSKQNDKKSSRAFVTSSSDADEIALPTNTKNLNNDSILFDNQASSSIFKNPNLLQNLRETPPKKFFGINDEVAPLVSTQAGSFGDFGLIPFHHNATANVISWSEAIDRGMQVRYDHVKDRILVTSPAGWRYIFSRSNGLYVANFRERERVSVTTVEGNETLYTAKQKLGAAKAMKFVRSLGFPPFNVVLDAIRHNTIRNIPIDEKDLICAKEIYGKELGTVMGKTTAPSPPTVRTDSVSYEVDRVLRLHVDLLFVNSHNFFLSVSEPLGLSMCSYLGVGKGSKTKSKILCAVKSHVLSYKSKQFDVREIISDNEPGMIASEEDIAALGVSLSLRGPNIHVPLVERKIRTVKEIARSTITSLPYKLPNKLLPKLISFAVSRSNYFPNKTGYVGISPREIYFGRKIDFNRDVRSEFGEFAHAYIPNVVSNSLAPRTEAVLLLQPSGNDSGSIICYKLDNGEFVVRDKWISLPMPKDAIVKLNQLELIDPDNISFQTASNMELNIPNQLDEFDEAPAPAPRIVVQPDLPILQPVPQVPQFLPPVDQRQKELLRPVDQQPGPEINNIPLPPNLDGVEVAGVPPQAQEPDIIQLPLQQDHIDDLEAPPMSLDPPSIPLQLPPLPSTPPNENYSLRPRKKLNYSDLHNHGFHITVSQAMKGNKEVAMESITKEIKQMLDKEVWTPMKPSDLSEAEIKSAIRSSLFLKEKYSSTGDLEELKSRLVAGGHMQDRTIYDDVSSPTASVTSLFMVLAIAAQERRKLMTCDITGAYLNAKMKTHKVYMWLQPVIAQVVVSICPKHSRYLTKGGSMLVRLDRALYGCIESAKLWFEHLSTTLIKEGFKQNPYEPCVLNKQFGSHQCTVLLYVDDILVSCEDENVLQKVFKILEDRYKQVKKKTGPVHSYLGMTIKCNPQGINVSMEGFTRDLLWQHPPTGKASSPATIHLHQQREIELADKQKSENFHTAVAKILYLAKRTRPDLLTAVSYLSTKVRAPDLDDLAKLQRLLNYINATPDLGINFSSKQGLGLTAWIDASFGVHSDGKSHSGILIQLAGGPIYAGSRKQRRVTKSSAEAELVALSNGGSQVEWCRNFLSSQGRPEEPTIIFQDNESTIKMVKNGKPNAESSRHVHNDCFWIKDMITQDCFKLVYAPTDRMIADLLTKPLQGKLLKSLRTLLLN